MIEAKGLTKSDGATLAGKPLAEHRPAAAALAAWVVAAVAVALVVLSRTRPH